jgi:RND family efflux transporter MFP subunit
VQVIRAHRGDVSRSITLPATVEAIETAPMHAKVSGYLAEISVDIGDRVKRDQILAVLDVPEMKGEYAAAEARLAEARAQRAKAEADLALQKLVAERQRGLRKRGAVTQQDLDEAEARHLSARATLELARAQVKRGEAEIERLNALMDYAKIKAPFDGVVVERRADPGALIQAATSGAGVVPMLVVARVDMVRVFIDIPEPEVAYVDLSDRATFAPKALKDVELSGQLTRSAQALNPSTGTMRTEIDFPNPEGRIYPGMYGMLTLGLDTHHDALTLPSSAVITDKSGQASVYVVEGGVAQRRPVRTGVDDGVRVEIIEGLTGTEQCIPEVSGALSDGVAVRVVGGAMGPGSGL